MTDVTAVGVANGDGRRAGFGDQGESVRKSRPRCHFCPQQFNPSNTQVRERLFPQGCCDNQGSTCVVVCRVVMLVALLVGGTVLDAISSGQREIYNRWWIQCYN